MQKMARIGLVFTMVAALSGCASFIAHTTGTAPLGTETGVRSFSQVLTDNSIERTATVNLFKLDPRFKFSRINISSFHSAALLTGQVGDEYLKQLAEDNLKAMSDVKTVHNYIAVADKIGYSTIMQDGLVTANIRRQLLINPDIADNKVKVQTEDGVVYVMGKLRPNETNALLSILQNTPNIVRVVSLIDNLTENGVPTGQTMANSHALVSAPTMTTAVGQQLTPVGTAAAYQDETPVAIDPEQAPPDDVPASADVDEAALDLQSTPLP